jgi:peptidoglycan/LPS O-acetylase OafA/YrhL
LDNFYAPEYNPAMKPRGARDLLPNDGQGVPPSRIKMVSRVSDFGRFFGASAIFYFHMENNSLAKWGEFAVAFFIILAGVAYTGFTSIKPTDLASYKRYIGTRLKAIFPIFIIINLGIYIASHFYPSALGRPFTFMEFLLSSSGLSQYFGYRYLSLVMWFIPFIIQAYFLFPFIDNCLNRVSGVLIIVVAFAVSLSFIALVFWCWPARAYHICRDWSVIFRLPEVCLGPILGRWIFYRQSFKSAITALVTFAVLSFIIATFGRLYFDQQAYILSLPWKGLIVTAIIVIASIVTTIILTPVRDQRFIRLLGTASFLFYLAHGVAIGFIFHRFGTRPLAWVAYFILCWCASIIFTVAFQRAEQIMIIKQLKSR